MFSISIVELGPDSYFWVLVYKKRWLATSEMIGTKENIEKEVAEVAEELQITAIFIEER